MIFNKESRQRVKEAESLWLAKFILRCICIIFAIVAIILDGVAVGKQRNYLQNLSHENGRYINNYYYGLSWGLGLVLIPLCASLLWNLANIVTRLTRTRPVHPGANVGCDLVIWLAFCGFLWIGYWLCIDALPGSTDSNNISPDIYCSGDNSAYCQDELAQANEAIAFENLNQQLAVLGFVACTLASILFLIHFALFVWACVDEHRRRREKHQWHKQKAVANILQDMQQRGLIVIQPPPQQLHPAFQNDLENQLQQSQTTQQAPIHVVPMPAPPPEQQQQLSYPITPHPISGSTSPLMLPVAAYQPLTGSRAKRTSTDYYSLAAHQYPQEGPLQAPTTNSTAHHDFHSFSSVGPASGSVPVQEYYAPIRHLNPEPQPDQPHVAATPMHHPVSSNSMRGSTLPSIQEVARVPEEGEGEVRMEEARTEERGRMESPLER